MPQLEEGNLWIQGTPAEDGLTRSGLADAAPKLRKIIASIPEIKGVMSHIGRPDDGTDVTSFFNLEFNAPLRPMEEWRTRPIDALRVQDRRTGDDPRGDPGRALDDEVRQEFPSVNFNFSQLIRDNVEEALSGVKGANSVKLKRDRPGDA